MATIKKKPTLVKIPDYVLALIVLGLTLFGVLMVYNTSVILAHEQFGDKFWFLKNQGIWAFLGIAGGYVVSNIDYHRWQKWARPLYLITLVLLVLVLIPGFSQEVYGARSRISFPTGLPVLSHLNIQPSEAAKFALVLYLATWLSDAAPKNTKSKARTAKQVTLKPLSTVGPFLTMVGLVIGLVMLQPDLGTSIIIAGGAMLIYFVAGVPILDLIIVCLIMIGGALGFTFSSDYRKARILTFLNPQEGGADISYHINQIMIALGSGGLFGLGLGHSRQKFQYLPEATTDSIFAVIGEELGFVGAMLILAAFVVIIWRGFEIVEQCDDRFGKLLAAGIIAIISVQAFLNLTGMVAITPLTGVPLPFISYGGSSLTMMLVSFGVLLNISKQERG